MTQLSKRADQRIEELLGPEIKGAVRRYVRKGKTLLEAYTLAERDLHRRKKYYGYYEKLHKADLLRTAL